MKLLKQLLCVWPILGIFLLSSCVNTSYKYFKQKPEFKSADRFLIGEIIGMDVNQSQKLFDWLTSNVDTAQLGILYLPMQEYELMGKGIPIEAIRQTGLSRGFLASLRLAVNADYFLQAEWLPLGGIDSPFPDDNSYEATLIFHLHDLNRLSSQKFRVRTSVGAFEIPAGNGVLSGASINISDEESAASIAFKKGWKKLVRGIAKP